MGFNITQIGNPTVFGDRRVQTVELTSTGTYPDEGEPLTPKDIGFEERIDFAVFAGIHASGDLESATILRYDYANQKVVAYESGAAGAAFVEKDGGTFPAVTRTRMLAFGR